MRLKCFSSIQVVHIGPARTKESGRFQKANTKTMRNHSLQPSASSSKRPDSPHTVNSSVLEKFARRTASSSQLGHSRETATRPSYRATSARLIGLRNPENV